MSAPIFIKFDMIYFLVHDTLIPVSEVRVFSVFFKIDLCPSTYFTKIRITIPLTPEPKIHKPFRDMFIFRHMDLTNT